MLFPSPPPYPSQRSAVMAENMVVASQPLAGQAGLSMLAQGGNAVDAALATAITLTQVEPTGNGLGSDAFAIIWDGRQLHGMNASGRSPAAWSPERFKATGIPDRGWDTVTVPGAIAGWVMLHEKFGKLPFEKLFEPAINYAQNGFVVSPIIGKMWGLATNELHDQPGFAEHFMPAGKAPRAGERFTSHAAAQTLRSIAETRGESFYRGHLAEKMVAHSAQHGGVMSLDDLANNKADWCGTVSQQFDGFSLHEIPPNGQGIAACMALGILANTGIRDCAGPDDVQSLHLMLEAMKLAFRDSAAYVADQAAMTDIMVEHLLDPDYLAARAALIDPFKAQDFNSGSPRKGGTVCLSAADASGMMVSFIQSNYAGFGSGVVVPDTGIHLQNRGCGFCTEPGHPNEVAGSKRPFHTIIPGFLMGDTDPIMAFGLMGGMMQAQGHLQMVLRTQLWGQDVQTAADAPRWRVTDRLGVSCEEAMDKKTLQALADMGHAIEVEKNDLAFGFGGAQLIHRLDAGGYAGGSDPRKDGGSYGY